MYNINHTMNTIKILKYLVLLALTINCLSCTMIHESSNVSNNEPLILYPEKLTEILIEGSTKAIIAINTSTNYGSQESAGNSPLKTSGSPVKHTHISHKKENATHFCATNLSQPIIPPFNKSFAKHQSQPSQLTVDPDEAIFYDEGLSQATGQDEDITAIKVASNATCVIYVEKSWYESEELASHTIFSTTRDNILAYFQDQVVPNAKTALGDTISNVTDVDNNNKVILFFTSMSSENVAGYVWSINLFPRTMTGAEKSNHKEILFINKNKINLEKIDTESYKHVIAHEYAHLLGQSYRYKKLNYNFSYHTWIEEGIAEGLTPILSAKETILKKSFTSLNEGKNGTGFLKIGKSIPVFSYQVSYTFLEYCRLQLNQQASFYKDLITHSGESGKTNYGLSGINDYVVLDNMILEHNPEKDKSAILNFEDALISYKIANFVKHPSNKYGYKNHLYSTFIPTLEPPSTLSPSLEASGSIYYISGNTYSESAIDTFIPSNTDENIKFFRITP